MLYREGLDALRLCLLSDGAEMIYMAAREHQMCPITSHAEGNATPNTRTTSGNQNDFIMQDTIGKDVLHTTRLVTLLTPERSRAKSRRSIRHVSVARKTSRIEGKPVNRQRDSR